MEIKKAILGLSLTIGMLAGMNKMQKTTEANLGYAVSAYFDADNNTRATNVVGGAAAGATAVAAAIYGAEIGAKIGVWGGLGGMCAGAVVGGL